ncbi:T9SS type A sorting domain-containing protein [Flavobacteriales bacterium]|nr:T9SS type A sorting domain-containing protein [Flavobacteriales bacterium]
MKKILLLLAIILSLLLKVNGQCAPNSIFTLLPIPGVYPPAVQIPNLPLPIPLGIADGSVGNLYAQTLTLVVLEDTVLDLATLLDPIIIATMNSFGISTVMSLNVNYVVFDVDGLPNGLTYTCDQSSCQYSPGVDGCILIDGTPSQGGTFSVPVNMTVNVQIPTIPNPITGIPIFAGMAMDLPAFPAVEYDLLISGGTAVTDYSSLDFTLFPNPTTNTTTLKLVRTADVEIYNILGKVVSSYSSVENTLPIRKSDLGIGVFYVSITTRNYKKIIKLLIE